MRPVWKTPGTGQERTSPEASMKPPAVSKFCIVAEELGRAQRRSGTKFPERLDWLTRSLLGVPAFIDGEHSVLSELVSTLPYQLLSGIGGTLLEAQLQKATVAIFLIHEFRTTATADTKLVCNANTLSGFLRLVNEANKGSDQDLQLAPGRMISWSSNQRFGSNGRSAVLAIFEPGSFAQCL
jgi:hypothetical protein